MHRTLSLASTILFGIAAVVFVPGCQAKAGDSCTKGTASCLDATNQLSCQGDKFVQVPCRGAKGCSVAGDKIMCDISANKAGDVCSTDDEGASACTADGKSMVACNKGKYVLATCGGPDGCKEKDGKYLCDKSIAAIGDKCDGAGNACTTDGKGLLECKDGKFAAKMDCKGPKGCDAKGAQITCDPGEEPAAAPSAAPDAAAPAPADSAAPAAAPAAD